MHLAVEAGSGIRYFTKLVGRILVHARHRQLNRRGLAQAKERTMTEAIEPDETDDDTVEPADPDTAVTIDTPDQVGFTTSADDAVQNEKP